MGYYSELVMGEQYWDHPDHSIISPAVKWKWRIEDLLSRLEDITTGKYGLTAHFFMDCQYSRDDLAYAPPEYFSRESDIMDAITLAKERLAATEAEETELRGTVNSKTITEELPEQLTIWNAPRAEPHSLTQQKRELKAAA